MYFMDELCVVQFVSQGDDAIHPIGETLMKVGISMTTEPC